MSIILSPLFPLEPLPWRCSWIQPVGYGVLTRLRRSPRRRWVSPFGSSALLGQSGDNVLEYSLMTYSSYTFTIVTRFYFPAANLTLINDNNILLCLKGTSGLPACPVSHHTKRNDDDETEGSCDRFVYQF